MVAEENRDVKVGVIYGLTLRGDEKATSQKAAKYKETPRATIDIKSPNFSDLTLIP